MKILIVDDETLARARMRSLIDDHGDGVVVGEAANGAAAVKLANALETLHQRDVILVMRERWGRKDAAS